MGASVGSCARISSLGAAAPRPRRPRQQQRGQVRAALPRAIAAPTSPARRSTKAHGRNRRGSGPARLTENSVSEHERTVWVSRSLAADQVERALFEIAPQIRQPVWLGWGDQDHGANMGAGVAKLAKLLPRCELRVFPGARHSLAAEVPDALAAAIDDFLTGPAEQLPIGLR